MYCNIIIEIVNEMIVENLANSLEFLVKNVFFPIF